MSVIPNAVINSFETIYNSNIWNSNTRIQIHEFNTYTGQMVYPHQKFKKN